MADLRTQFARLRRESSIARWLWRVYAPMRRGLARVLWPIARRIPRVPVVLLSPIAHETTGQRTLEAVADWAQQRLADAPPGARPRLRELVERSLVERGRVDFYARQPGEGMDWFTRAHEIAGPTARTWTWIGMVHRRRGELAEATQAGEAALALDPHWRPALVHLGNLHHQLGDRATSVEFMRRVVAEGTATRYELTRAWVGFERLRELDDALVAAEQLVRRYDRPTSHAVHAVTLWEMRRRDEAEAAMERFTSRRDAASVRGMAWYLGRTRRSAEAYARLFSLRGAQTYAGDYVELFHMLRRDGHLARAHAAADAALERFPGHHELTRLRDEVAGEVRVFTGAWVPADRDTAQVEPIRGRVLHVVGKSVPYAHTGYCVRTARTVTAQHDDGLDVHVVTEPGFPFELGIEAADDHEIIDGVPHHRLRIPDDARRPLQLDERLDIHVDTLSTLVEELRPAVLHAASDFRNALAALAVGERYNLPVVYEMRGFWEETWLAKREGQGDDADAYLLRQQRELECAQRASRVVTLAATMRDVLIERGVDADKISLAPNAVDPDDFPVPERNDALAARLGIRPGQTVVGYISSFVGYEGIHVLVEAIAKARAAGDDVVGVLVGDGLVRPELERQAADLGIAEHVIFTGRVPHADILDSYGLIDIFVVPRTNARVCQLVSPLKPFEAMATQRALVVSGTPVLRSLIDEGVTGVSFTPEDANDLAARIRELASAPQRRAALGEAARAHVLANHTWAHNAKRYREVYAALGVLDT